MQFRRTDKTAHQNQSNRVFGGGTGWGGAESPKCDSDAELAAQFLAVGARDTLGFIKNTQADFPSVAAAAGMAVEFRDMMQIDNRGAVDAVKMARWQHSRPDRKRAQIRHGRPVRKKQGGIIPRRAQTDNFSRCYTPDPTKGADIDQRIGRQAGNRLSVLLSGGVVAIARKRNQVRATVKL